MSTPAEQLALANQEAIWGDELSDHNARLNIAEYLREEKMPPGQYAALAEHHRRIIADARLLVAIADIPRDEQGTDRDKLVDFFEGQDWTPKTAEEAASALPKWLKVAGLKKPRSKRSQAGKEKDFIKARELNSDAISDLMTFGEIGVHEKRRDKKMNTSWLRQNRQGQYMIADFLMARESLDRGDWPKPDGLEYLQRQSYWRGLMLLAAEHAGSDALEDTLRFFFDKAQERQRHSSRQYMAAGARLGRPILRGVDIPVPETEPKRRPQSIEEIMPPELKIKVRIESDDASEARIANEIEQSSSPRAAEMKETAGGRVIRNEAGKGVMPPDRKPSAHAWAVHDERAQKSKRVRAAAWKRKADSGPSDKAHGEIQPPT